jgi:hypothetical protein
MDLDLEQFLRDFPYEAGRLNARIVRVADGREVVQVRVEMGVLQMEAEGRPDRRPSVFARLRDRARQHRGRLGSGEAAELRLELVQHQQRAIAFLAIGEPKRALADADHVLAGASLLAEAATNLEGEWAEGARFSAIVLRTRAAAAMLAIGGRGREAGALIDAGLEMLRDAADRAGIGDQFDRLGDVTALRALRDTLVPQLPPAQRSELEGRLRAAIQSENFELAAILRDELRLL